jgi:protein phosphatase
MGDHAAGDVASRLAASSIRSYMRESLQSPGSTAFSTFDDAVSPITNLLGGAVSHANRVIFREARQRPVFAGMGTTVVGLLIRGQVASIAHVGDSRLYLIRNRNIDCLTIDHSIEVAWNAPDLVDRDTTKRSRRTSALTRAVGVADSVEVELSETPLLQGDVLILCSDGLTGEVTPDAMLETVLARNAPEPIAEHLVSLAKTAGERGNVTALVLTIHAGTSLTLWDRIRQRFRHSPPSTTISKENFHA